MSHTPPEYTTSVRAQPRRLSSVLTPLFKLGLSSALIAIGFACTYVYLRKGPIDLCVIDWVFPWTFILVLAHWCLRLKKVVAHSDHLVVSNCITDTRVPYDDIEEIKGYRARSAVFVRLRLRTACRYGRTIHFLLPSTLSRIESQPEVELLRQKCPQLCERSGNWCLAALYLRPRDIREAGRADEEAGRRQHDTHE